MARASGDGAGAHRDPGRRGRDALLVVLRPPHGDDLHLERGLRGLSARAIAEGVYVIPCDEAAFDAARALTREIERHGGLAILGRGSVVG